MARKEISEELPPVDFAATPAANKRRVLPPGRELDAAIADQVFGLSSIDDGEAHGDKPSGIYSLLEPDEHSPAGMSRTRELPFYSTDIEAAWEVMEKLAANKDDRFEIVEASHDKVLGWCCRLAPAAGPCEPFVFATGETAPHAICLAALKALEVSHLPLDANGMCPRCFRPAGEGDSLPGSCVAPLTKEKS